MLTYSDFYDLAWYCNKNNRGKFTEKEIAENAHQLWVEFEESKKSHICSFGIKSLIEQLKDDETDASNDWVNDILDELGANDPNRRKYMVRVVETYSRDVEIIAENEDEVYEIIDEKVGSGEIDLPCDGGDYEYNRELFVSEVKLL